MLDEFNYKEYRLELLSEEEKIKLFSNARNIIGGHGAGLMNMMFCSNANVIAIICEDSTQGENRTVRGIFKYLAISLEIDYYELFSEISYANYLNANFKSSLKEYDLNVDLDKLKYLMKKSNMI
jgi:capsular polysaccharide biosynthesis protein